MISPEIFGIAAITKDGGMGYQNDLLIKNRYDMLRFRELTKDTVMVMGGKTFRSLPQVLPGRIHVVVTRHAEIGEQNPAVHVAPDVDAAFEVAETLARSENRRIAVIGGAEIFVQALYRCRRFYLTTFDAVVESCDTWFPVDLLRILFPKPSHTSVFYDGGLKMEFADFESPFSEELRWKLFSKWAQLKGATNQSEESEGAEKPEGPSLVEVIMPDGLPPFLVIDSLLINIHAIKLIQAGKGEAKIHFQERGDVCTIEGHSAFDRINQAIRSCHGEMQTEILVQLPEGGGVSPDIQSSYGGIALCTGAGRAASASEADAGGNG